jgi:hypothetical protein
MVIVQGQIEKGLYRISVAHFKCVFLIKGLHYHFRLMLQMGWRKAVQAPLKVINF